MTARAAGGTVSHVHPVGPLLALALASLTTLGCGSPAGASGAPRDAGTEAGVPGPGDGGADDGSVDAGAPFVEATHAPLPQVAYLDGGILATPRVVTVTFQGDPLAKDLESFDQSLATSTWWSTVTAGDCEPQGTLCVRPGALGIDVELGFAAAPEYTDSADGGSASLQGLLANQIETNSAFPKPSASTLYVLFVAGTTRVTFEGATSCAVAPGARGTFGGYHASFLYGGTPVTYAVVDECPADTSSSAATLDVATAQASHEIIEATTDPIAGTGFALDPSEPSAWSWIDLTGGEVADLCTDFFGLGQDVVSEGAYAVTRVWSNAEAAAGHDPCVPLPSPAAPYFNAAPERSFFVLDVGASVTFDVVAFADAPRGDWTFGAVDLTSSSGTFLSFAIADATGASVGDAPPVNDGTTLAVTMTLEADPATLGPDAQALAVLASTDGPLTSPTAGHVWPIAVMSSAQAARRP